MRDEAQKSDLVDLTVQVHAKTERAVLVSDSGERDTAVWVPLSQCEMSGGSAGGIVTLTIPEWMATDRGLV